MNKLFIIAFLCLAQYAGFAQATALKWATKLEDDGTSTFPQSQSYDVAVDPSGNVYTLGYFTSVFDFDAGAAVYNLEATKGRIFILKQDSNGHFLWAKNFGMVNTTAVNIALDKDNNVLVGGAFSDTIDFDPSPGVYNMMCNDAYEHGYNAFISKLDSNGNFVWAKSFANRRDSMRANTSDIATDRSGNIYSVGGFGGGDIDFDPGAGVYPLSCDYWYGGSVFVSKLDANGNFIWAKQLACMDERGGRKMTTGHIIALDASDNVIVSGSFSGTSDFDPGAGVYNVTAARRDGFITKLDNSGNHIWTKQIASSTSAEIYSMKLDYMGNIICSGLCQGTTDLDPGTATYAHTPSIGMLDNFIIKLDATGKFNWARTTSTVFYASIGVLDVDDRGNVYICNAYTDSMYIQKDTSASIMYYTMDRDDHNILLLKWNSKGDHLWSKQIRGTEYSEVKSIEIDRQKNIHLVGSFKDTLDFDFDTGVYIKVNKSITAFVLKMGQPDAVLSVSELSGVGSIVVYPNPTQGLLYLSLPSMSAPAEVIVFNALGKKVLAYEATNERFSLDLSQQPNGLYLVQVLCKDGTSASTKVMKD